MRNRRYQLGKSVKLRKLQEAPSGFALELAQAIQLGDEFPPNYVELNHKQRLAKLQSIQKGFRKYAGRNYGALMAILGLFHYSLAQCILANPDEERWLVKEALHNLIQAQNELMQALLWLPESDRTTIFNTANNSLLQSLEWRGHYRGIMCTARFAYAAIKLGCSIRMAKAQHDLHRKIDFFMEPPIQGCPTLCVQVKSCSQQRGVQLYYLDSKPIEQGSLSEQDFKLHQSVWRGVSDFNRYHNRNWKPLIVQVGILPISENMISSEIMQEALEELLAELVAKSLFSDSVRTAKEGAYTACA